MSGVDFHTENIKFYSHFGISEESGVPAKRIALVLQKEFSKNSNAQQTFIFAGNLLARIFLNIDFIVPKGTTICDQIENDNRGLDNFVISYAQEIFSLGNFKSKTEIDFTSDYDGILIVGNIEDNNSNTISVISNGWNVFMNYCNITSDNYNPVVACAAACIGTAELFKYVIKPSNSRLCDNLTFSLLTYDTTLTAGNPDLPSTIDVGEVTLVGAGAIGSAMVYSLRSLENVLGQLDVVDRDKYSVTNLNRYVIATELTIGKSKAETVKSIFRKHSSLVVNAHDSLYNEFKANHPKIDTLITAVDKKITRFNIQSDLPRLIFDAATTGSQIDLARVDFGTEGACLGCVYLPDERDNQLLHIIAENIGLNYERVKQLYDSSEGINAEDVAIISRKIGKAIDHCLNEPIESVYVHEYCGSDRIESNVNVNETILAPLSFISALAGVILTCELIKDRYFPEYRVNNHFLIDTLKLPNPKLHSFRRKNPKCPYCNNPIYLDVYRKKWNR